MAYETLNFDIKDNIAWITINRPDALNAINLQCCRELLAVADHCTHDKSVRAAVLTGSGDTAFCAGGDVANFAEQSDTVDQLIRDMTSALHLAVSRFANMPAPLIAAVNGIAAGAGFSLMSSCDLAIASDKAKFTSAYTKIGLTPDGSSTYYLTRIIGMRRTMELYLTNRVLSAQEALDWGLINQISSSADLMEETTKLAQKLATGPTRAHHGVKKLVHMAFNDSLESQMERETRWIAASSLTDDGQEGVRAFVEKRAPEFTGK